MLIFLYSALIVVFDQLFKQWIIITHAVGEETVLIDGFFSLFRLHNTGAAFGFMAGLPWWVLAAIQLAASIALIMIILRYTEGFWGSLGLASVLGGAVGNLIDRIMHQHVVDMFRFTFIDFAIFNLADVFITLGFLMFLIHFIAYTFKSDKNKQALADGAEDADMMEYGDEQAVVMGEYPFGTASPVASSTPTAPAQPDFTTFAQVEPAVYEIPTPVVEPANQAMVQPTPQPITQLMPQQIRQQPAQQLPQQLAQQPIAQPFPQQPAQLAPLPMAQPAPQAVSPQEEDMTQYVDPAMVFGASANADSAKPLLEPASQTGPLPTNEIAPLLDHVYGGQYIAKRQESAAPAPTAPLPMAAPAAPAAAPVAEPALAVGPVPVAQPIPAVQPAPVAQPVPAAQPAPAVQPMPVAQPAPETQLAPAAQAVPATSQAETPPQADDNPEAMLDALTALESELLGENALDDYNADKLLGEYGFESEDKN